MLINMNITDVDGLFVVLLNLKFDVNFTITRRRTRGWLRFN